MATPMQYELANQVLQAVRSGDLLRGRFSKEAGDGEGEDHTALIRQSWAEIASAITSGVPMIDASDIFRQIIVPRGEITEWHPRMYADVVRPWLNDTCNGFPPMAWPRAVFCADVGFGEVSMWLVIDANEVRVARTDVPAHLTDMEAERTYVSSMYAATLVDGRLAATRLREQEPVEWAGMNRWALCTRFTLAYCAAKNARWVETAPNRATRRRAPGVAGIRFRHVEIDMGEAKRRQEHGESESTGVAWHHRRGHWAYVSPERPLFGHHGPNNSGWFWRPYTEVGDKKHGTIVQDYSVSDTL